MTKLILIRHGETEKNIFSKLHHADDPETLNEKGKAQMKITTPAIQKMNVAIIYFSEEKRAQQSASILSKKLNVPTKTISGMQGRNWGDLSGKPWPEVQAILDKMTLKERYNYIPPSGKSWKESEKRPINTLNKVLKANKGKTIAVVSHGGSIRILMSYLLGAPKEETFKHNPDNASLTIFDYSKGKFYKQSINDTSHLPKALK